MWSKDGIHSSQQASVQISASECNKYVAILIGGGAVSNVNNRPPRLQDVIP
jgi:hypothetical protein